MHLNTPKEWIKKTFLYNQKIKEIADYNYESLVYSEKSVVLDVCWQPVQTDVSSNELGRNKIELLEAVIYDREYTNVKITEGDRIVINDKNYLVQSVKYFISYRLVTIKTECI